MSTHTATKVTPEIVEAFAFAGRPTEISRWGFMQTRDGARLVRVTEDDGTYRVIVMSSDRAELIHSELEVSGAMANPATLAALIELGLDS